MSLTLQPVNASLFIKPDPRAMEAVRVHSLEAINILPKEQLTGTVSCNHIQIVFEEMSSWTALISEDRL